MPSPASDCSSGSASPTENKKNTENASRMHREYPLVKKSPENEKKSSKPPTKNVDDVKAIFHRKTWILKINRKTQKSPYSLSKILDDAS